MYDSSAVRLRVETHVVHDRMHERHPPTVLRARGWHRRTDGVGIESLFSIDDADAADALSDDELDVIRVAPPRVIQRVDTRLVKGEFNGSACPAAP
jgi:hypothetical protein